MEKVVSTTQTVEPYHLDELTDSVCWGIFSSLAFGDGEEKRYPRLCEIGQAIVDKCCGIPLVVQCLGSLLRGERDEGEWMRIKNMDNLNLLDDGRYKTVKQLLKLSYDKLPSHLKPGFAHLSLFAKDNVYTSYYHSYCWSALGLLQLRDGSYTNHNVFSELISRSMIQDGKWGLNQKISKFKMHDLLHDLAGDVLGEDLVVVTRNQLNVPDAARYIAWASNDLANQEFPEQVKAKKARVFMFQYSMRSVSQSFVHGIISNMPCLRILGLGSVQIERLPSTIGNLKHLRVLDLSNNGLIKSLPDSICELLNLECLLLAGCNQLEKLPSEIFKLISLRFLFLTTSQKSLVGTKFNRLPCLRHMLFASCTRLNSLWDSEVVGCLTSLRSLSIVNCPKLTSLPNSMKLLVELEELMIGNCQELDLENGQSLSGLRNLHTLAIKGVRRLSAVPNGIQCANNSLKYLHLSDCVGLAELPSWLQSCAFLEDMVILNCPNLLCLPEGIRHLNSLQHLKIGSCQHISRRCAVPDGEDLSDSTCPCDLA